jgi:hypothetical protein
VFAQRSCLGAVGAVLMLASGALLLVAWLFMQAVAAARSEWAPELPPLGYWSSVKVCAFGVPAVLAPVLSQVEVADAPWPFAIPFATGMLFLVSWLFMLGVGVVHGEWLAGLPTIGFWASVKIWIFAVPLMFISVLRPQRLTARVTATGSETETHDE